MNETNPTDINVQYIATRQNSHCLKHMVRVSFTNHNARKKLPLPKGGLKLQMQKTSEKKKISIVQSGYITIN